MRKSKDDSARIFALDIGTRSVIGIIGRLDGEVFRVELLESEEYTTRAVIDGQIENIDETAKVALKVKKRLEQQLGAPLKNVYVAAAGRVLRTAVSESTLALGGGQLITEREVDELEREAVRLAYESLSRDDDQHDFFCVGYSIKGYTLDQYPFSNLIGHRGKEASVSMIVTFLPKEVVDSLYTTMSQIGLTVAGLTLEPIAAMNAIVPADLRKLNLALCDIGAGTSDIAICDKGSIKSYGVATVAGDEITEAIMQSCLVDFTTAEQIKKQLSPENHSGALSYENIMGITVECSVEEVVAGIIDAVDLLAKTIAEKILSANERVPNAVFLVGGGSQTPGLKARLATALGIEEDRVAVGGKVHMKRMFVSERNISGPEFATPLGIAWTAAQRSSAGSLTVTINGKKLHLFNVWDSTVLGVLQTAGYRYAQIVGSNGRSVTFTLNGRRKTCYGGLPTVAEVLINDRQGSVTDTVKAGDVIQFTPSTPGADAVVRAADLIPEGVGGEAFEMVYQNEPLTAGTVVLINGEKCEAGRLLANGDRAQVRSIYTVDDLRAFAQLGDETLIFVNGELKTAEYKLKPGDRATAVLPADGERGATQEREEEPPAVVEAEEEKKPLRIRLNGKELALPAKESGGEYQMYDLLTLVYLFFNNPTGGLIQKRNGRNAAYTDRIFDGDTVVIDWEK